MATATDTAQVVPISGSAGTQRAQTSVYKRWVQAQEVPVTTGLSVYDLYALECKPWAETGVNMNFVVLDTTGDLSDFWVMELPPGGQLKPFRHMFHAMYHVLTGRGATSVWVEGKKKQTFEWQRGSLFAIPKNAWYEHFNGSGSEPARLVAMTTAPIDLRLNPDQEFIFNNPATFPKLFSGEESDFFSADGNATSGRIWQSNFVADVRSMETQLWRDRGAAATNRMFSMGASFVNAHISDFEPGTYKKAHRHGPAPHVMLLSGNGYSLNWADAKDKYQIDWKDGTVYCPPNYFWHQHFNPGHENARYLAFTMGGGHLTGKAWPADRTGNNLRSQGDQIDYDEEQPYIHDHFVEECKKQGTTPNWGRMDMDAELKLPTDSFMVQDPT